MLYTLSATILLSVICIIYRRNKKEMKAKRNCNRASEEHPQWWKKYVCRPDLSLHLFPVNGAHLCRTLVNEPLAKIDTVVNKNL